MSPIPSESTAVVPDPDVVTELLADQAPHLADMPVRVSPASGSSNWVFRLGDEMAVRLPRADRYVPDLLKEIRWLPHLAPHVVSPVPDVIFVGPGLSTIARYRHTMPDRTRRLTAMVEAVAAEVGVQLR